MNIIKKPYEISIWKDLLMYVGTPESGKTSPTSNLGDLSSVDYQYYDEERLAVIGSDVMTSPARVVNPVFKKNINGTETLTFDMYYQYEDVESGGIIRNPLIDLVIDERKVKLFYENEWHDFIVKKDDEKGRDYKYSYTCTGLAANELGKTGFNIELDTDLENNMGTVTELGKEVLRGSDWQLRDEDQEIIKQTNEEALVNESINDTNQKLFDSITQTLELQRQERTNAETENELTDKEKRLAYLQQDSSNANQVEIAKLQKEIDDARQDYTDNLIDQKISELQRQNDEAANQRQQQIELMQRSLDWEEKSGAFWDEVYRLISLGTDATGALIHQSDLENVLKGSEGWEALSEEGKMNWLKTLEDQVAQGFSYLEMGRQLEDIGTKAGSSITFTNANGEKLTGTVDKEGNVVVKNSDGSTTTYKDVFQDYHGAFRTFENSGETKIAPSSTTSTTKSTTTAGTGNKNNKVPDNKGWHYNETHHWHEYTDGTKYGEEPHNFKQMPDSSVKVCTECKYVHQKSNAITQVDLGPANIQTTTTGKGRLTTPTVVANASNTTSTNEQTQSDIISLLKNKKIKAYASGGLNTYSGIAWLDGTRSNPELVLNARDTENFIELKDTLASIKSNGGLSLTGGDNYYDIKVQVDSLGSDYDVDKAIDRIKTRIAQENAYRNVNALSRLR